MIADLPPPSSKLAMAALYVIPFDSLNTSIMPHHYLRRATCDSRQVLAPDWYCVQQ